MPCITIDSPHFESHISKEGITFVSLSEDSKCGSCIKLKESIEKIGSHDNITSIIVDTKKHPVVRYKYGITSNNCVMIYNKSVFVKRLFPGQGNYKLFVDIIDKINSGVPLDNPEQVHTISGMTPNIKMSVVPFSDFNLWLEDEDNRRIVMSINNKMFFNNNTNEFYILIPQPRGQ